MSISQVAEKAGVSSMTVSRVLTGTGSVSDKTRKRILTTMANLGYVPSGLRLIEPFQPELSASFSGNKQLLWRHTLQSKLNFCEWMQIFK
jgi:transcriptional regulator with XRE-family HTH domain